MLGVVVDMFKQIAGVIGVPGIPYPLSLVPKCITAVPYVTSFVLKAPMMVGEAVYGKLKDMTLQMANMQFPEFPDGIAMPSAGAKCPKHSSKEAASNETDDNAEEASIS